MYVTYSDSVDWKVAVSTIGLDNVQGLWYVLLGSIDYFEERVCFDDRHDYVYVGVFESCKDWRSMLLCKDRVVYDVDVVEGKGCGKNKVQYLIRKRDNGIFSVHFVMISQLPVIFLLL